MAQSYETPGLAEAIEAVREEIIQAQRLVAESGIGFRVGPVEMDFEVGLSTTASFAGGLKVFVLTQGGEMSPGVTHRVKLTLQPTENRVELAP